MKYFFFFWVLSFVVSCSQPIEKDENKKICNSKFEFAYKRGLAELPIGETIVQIGKSFIGTEYVSHTLEKGTKESLVVNLSGLDCYTFLEATFALARCVKKGERDFDNFRKEIENIRYRDGELTDYPSRLHYFSDWIWDNARRGNVVDVTKSLGGKPYANNISFMSDNPHLYKQLKNNPVFLNSIKNIEKRISERKYYFLPQNKISAIESKIQSGDFIGITTNTPGLDIAHTGIAVRLKDGRIHLLHAPNVGKKVQISELPLADYIKQHKNQTGIMVARATELSAKRRSR